MISAIKYIKDYGPAFGYHIRFDKGKYLLGKCTTLLEAQQRKQQLMELGFSETVIVIHPDNLPSSKPEYGAKILGSYIGTDEFIAINLNEVLSSWLQTCNKLLQFPDLQGRMILLRQCFTPKIYHVLRTISPHPSNDLVRQFSNMQKIILKSILGYDYMDELTWTQAQFAIRDGGLGLNQLEKVQHAAYVSSILGCREELSVIFPDLIQNMMIAPQLPNDREPPDIVNQFQSSVAQITECLEDITLQNIFTLHEQQQQMQSKFTEILTKNQQQQFRIKLESDTKRLSWYQSICGSEAGLWLSALPKTDAQRMTNKEYQIALCYRLYLEQPLVINGCRCDCKNHPPLDLRGHHLMTGCGKHGYRHATHDGLVTELHQILNYLGIRNRVEETRCFQQAHPNSNRRPDISILPGPFTNFFFPFHNLFKKLIFLKTN